jgi:ACR3 family arsenite efflux pump ArsB
LRRLFNSHPVIWQLISTKAAVNRQPKGTGSPLVLAASARHLQLAIAVAAPPYALVAPAAVVAAVCAPLVGLTLLLQQALVVYLPAVQCVQVHVLLCRCHALMARA